MVLLEICADSVESIQNAVNGGADRIELCSALSEGGLTPSVGLFRAAKKITKYHGTAIFVMIRIRGGNFNYSDDEVEAMVEDVKFFKENDADGIVFGALKENLEVDVDACFKILKAWGCNKPATFHRAIDETKLDCLYSNLLNIESLGFNRILTSGLEATAEAGAINIQDIMGIVWSLTIIPGCGINKDNVATIVDETQCREIHASARAERDISTRLSIGGNKIFICDQRKVEEIKEILTNNFGYIT